MDITVGEWLLPTKRLTDLLPQVYLKGKTYKVLEHDGFNIIVQDEKDHLAFQKGMIGNYFTKSLVIPLENELWI